MQRMSVLMITLNQTQIESLNCNVNASFVLRSATYCGLGPMTARHSDQDTSKDMDQRPNPTDFFPEAVRSCSCTCATTSSQSADDQQNAV